MISIPHPNSYPPETTSDKPKGQALNDFPAGGTVGQNKAGNHAGCPTLAKAYSQIDHTPSGIHQHPVRYF